MDTAQAAALVHAAIQGAASGGATRQGLAAAAAAALRTGAALLSGSAGPAIGSARDDRDPGAVTGRNRDLDELAQQMIRLRVKHTNGGVGAGLDR